MKTDAIGDFLLFRNLLHDVAQEFKPKGYQIHLLGNALWKPLAEELDAGVVDHFFWLNKPAFTAPLADAYRIEVVQALQNTVYHSALYPNLSREMWAGDWIMQHITAVHKTGYRGDTQNQSPAERDKGNPIYTRLVDPTAGVLFEFDRNRHIVGHFLGKDPPTRQPSIRPTGKPGPASRYVVFFPGASTPQKHWPLQRFTQVAAWIETEYHLPVVVAGGAEDTAAGEAICSALKTGLNRAGQTSLIQLIDLIAGAVLLVTNDTSAVHIGAQCGVPTVCLFKGNHYGRFLPYPQPPFAHVHICLPEGLEILSWEVLAGRYGQTYGEDINQIEVDRVKEAIARLLAGHG